MNEAGYIHKELKAFLIHKKFTEQWNRILKNSKNSRQLQYQKLNWFDGFKTLKLVHHLRDNAYPVLNMFDAVDQLFLKIGTNVIKKGNAESIPRLNVQREYLYKLREIDNK
jgi:hypothetical protein